MKLYKITLALCMVFLSLVSITTPGLSLSIYLIPEYLIPENDEVELIPTLVLITGFEPFHVNEVNPAQLIAENLSGQIVKGSLIIGIIVPVIWDTAVDVVVQAIKDFNPSLVISIGMGVKDFIQVEKIGLNIKSSRIPDNEGRVILLQRISSNGPFFRFSSLPTRDIVTKIKNQGIPAKHSYFAGTFICNEVFYGVLSYIKKHDLPIQAGFIHVPSLLSQDREAGMELGTMIDAVKIVIETSLQ